MASVGATTWDRGRHGWYVRTSRDGRRRARKVGPPGEEGRQIAEALVAEIKSREARGKLWEGDAERLPTDALLRA